MEFTSIISLHILCLRQVPDNIAKVPTRITVTHHYFGLTDKWFVITTKVDINPPTDWLSNDRIVTGDDTTYGIMIQF